MDICELLPSHWEHPPRSVVISGAFSQLSISTHPSSLDILPRCVYPPLRQAKHRTPTCPAAPQIPLPTPLSCYQAALPSGAFPSLGNTPLGRSVHSHTQTLAGSRPLRGFGAVVAACLADWDTVWCWDKRRSGQWDSCSARRHCRRLFAVNKSIHYYVNVLFLCLPWRLKEVARDNVTVRNQLTRLPCCLYVPIITLESVDLFGQKFGMNIHIGAHPNAFVILISIHDIRDLLGPTKPPRTTEPTFNVKQNSWNTSRKI